MKDNKRFYKPVQLWSNCLLIARQDNVTTNEKCSNKWVFINESLVPTYLTSIMSDQKLLVFWLEFFSNFGSFSIYVIKNEKWGIRYGWESFTFQVLSKEKKNNVKKNYTKKKVKHWCVMENKERCKQKNTYIIKQPWLWNEKLYLFTVTQCGNKRVFYAGKFQWYFYLNQCENHASTTCVIICQTIVIF